MILSLCVYVCKHCVCSPEVNLGMLPMLPVPFFFFFWPGIHWFSWTDWPMSPRHLPLHFPAKIKCQDSHAWLSYIGSEDQTQVLKLERQTLLRYHPNPKGRFVMPWKIKQPQVLFSSVLPLSHGPLGGKLSMAGILAEIVGKWRDKLWVWDSLWLGTNIRIRGLSGRERTVVTTDMHVLLFL